MTHICVGNLAIIDSNNGSSPGRCQTIIWTNAGKLLIEPLGINSSEISKQFHSRKCSWKWRLENGAHFVSTSICEAMTKIENKSLFETHKISFPGWAMEHRIYCGPRLYFVVFRVKCAILNHLELTKMVITDWYARYGVYLSKVMEYGCTVLGCCWGDDVIKGINISWYGNVFRPLWGDFSGYRWIPLTKGQ